MAVTQLNTAGGTPGSSEIVDSVEGAGSPPQIRQVVSIGHPDVSLAGQYLKPDANGAIPVTSADGAQATIGTTTDASSANTLIGLLKAVKAFFTSGAHGALPVEGVVSGTPIPVSNASLPLPSNAAQETGGNLATLAGAVSGSKVAVKSADGDQATIGAKADAKNAATDTTAISAVSIWKQISFSIQAVATSVAGTLTATLAAGSNLIGKVAGSDGSALLTAPAATGNAAAGMLATAGQLWRSGTTWDSWRSVGASGWQQGVAAVGGGTNSVDYTASPRSTASVNAIDSTAEAGIKRRSVYIANGTDQPITVSLTGYVYSQNIGPVTVHATFANAGAHYLIANLGATAGLGFRNDGTTTGVSSVSGIGVLLDLPFDEFIVAYSFGVAPTSGSIFVSYRGQS